MSSSGNFAGSFSVSNAKSSPLAEQNATSAFRGLSYAAVERQLECLQINRRWNKQWGKSAVWTFLKRICLTAEHSQFWYHVCYAPQYFVAASSWNSVIVSCWQHIWYHVSQMRLHIIMLPTHAAQITLSQVWHLNVVYTDCKHVLTASRGVCETDWSTSFTFFVPCYVESSVGAGDHSSI